MHRLSFIALALAACSPAATQQVPVKSADVKPPPEPSELSDEAARIQTAFSVRHDPPSCEAVTAGMTDPHGAMVEVVEQVTLPAWVPMLAASCLVEQHPEAESARFVTWVTDPEWAGAGRMVLGRLDVLPEPVALQIGEAGLKGSLADVTTEQLKASERPALRALVTE